jgi:hypothetical protein
MERIKVRPICRTVFPEMLLYFDVDRIQKTGAVFCAEKQQRLRKF